ncbi:MAG: ATP-binding protein [Spirochaetia bacterium]|nr:ATP-binding protein [Spirochaetia bacterium]
MAALDGRYGAVTRLSSEGQRSVSLYIAIPVLNSETVIGAVLCSQSTFRILQDMYAIRLVLLKIFLWSFLFALIISIVLAYSISFRIQRLRNEAESIRTGKGKLEGYFTPSIFMDEIGYLSFSLADLASRMDKHFRYTASFIQDFSHEFKNPLSVVRTASEMIPDSTGEQQYRFLELIDQNSRRMEFLLDSITELSLIAHLIPGFQLKYPHREWKLKETPIRSKVFGTKDKLSRVFINILENANSFASSGTPVEIVLTANNSQIRITIFNYGSSIPSVDLDRIFDRFYSNRVSREHKHSGLGLSISQTIVQSYNGSIKAENKDKGVIFIIDLPL